LRLSKKRSSIARPKSSLRVANNGLCLAVKMGQTQFYMAAPFVPGILEFQFMRGTKSQRDTQIAKLIHDYKGAFEASGGPIMESKFPFARVITVDSAIESESTIHTCDQVQSIIDNSDLIGVATCYCRHAADLRGEDLHGMPKDVCMLFGPIGQYAIERLGAKMISKEEARGF